MKTFIRTIVILVLLNLATGCFASAQSGYGGKMEAERQAEEIEEMAEKWAEDVERRVENIVVPQVPGRGTGGPHPLPFITGISGGSGPVFVIPSSQMKAEDLVTIVEDMKVMSRIFDKKLGLSSGGMLMGHGFDFNFFGSATRSTEALFLQDYGVLFLMKVDFPLSPPAEEEEEVEEETKEHVDELWKETRQEIYEPAEARRRSADEEKEEYDEQEVEEMKETLIKALKHTTNIRNLKAGESVILTITGSGDSSGTTIALRNGANRVLIKGNGTIKMGGYAGPSLKGTDFSPTVMTLRVKKSDVDAFAKGKLDFDKFCQKVQIFTY